MLESIEPRKETRQTQTEKYYKRGKSLSMSRTDLDRSPSRTHCHVGWLYLEQ
jgi:hypothetical protein